MEDSQTETSLLTQQQIKNRIAINKQMYQFYSTCLKKTSMQDVRFYYFLKKVEEKLLRIGQLEICLKKDV